MKKGNIFSSSPLDSNMKNNKNDNLINLDQKQNNVMAKNNNNSFNNFMNVSEDDNKEEFEKSELNNFNIEFFLPNELKEELNINKNLNEEQEKNTVEIKNQKELYFKDFNKFPMDEKIIKNNEKDKIKDKRINSISMNKENLNPKEVSKQCKDITELLLNEIESENKGNFSSNNIQNDNKEVINKNNTSSMNLNDVIKINNNYNLNNCININEQNFFPKNFNYNNANSIEFLNQNYKQNIFPFNNNNLYFPPPNNYNNIYGSNFVNNQIFFNGNKFINPINQINFNFNQFNTVNNNMNYFNFNTGQQKRKIIDEYTLEMFGRIGWICKQCNNFNYETRQKCNRCHIKKIPKRIIKEESSQGDIKDSQKFDWICSNCKNFNYSFRMICNRCHMKKND